MAGDLMGRISRDLEAAFPGATVFVDCLEAPFATFEIRDLDTLPDRLRELRDAFEDPRYTPEKIRASISYVPLRGAYVVSLHAVTAPGVMSDV
jgi:hypothetical protein